MFNLFDFYRSQILDFERTEAEINAIIEEIANNEELTNGEYCTLYEIAVQKIQTL